VPFWKTMNYKKLNIGWNADPNAPNVELAVVGKNLKIKFNLNPFIFERISEGAKGELIFNLCFKYSFNSCNDEGYFNGQYRYKEDQLPWGEFYEIQNDWKNDFHPDFKVLNNDLVTKELKYFIFFFKDNTLECVAADFEFNNL
jgi:hypothetical protein